MPGMDWKLGDDLKTVTVSFPTTPPIALKLNLADVEDILRNLGEFRAVMKPEIPKSYAMGQTVRALPNPAWVTEPDALAGDSLLHLRDPRYGWLHYLIPREEARNLARYLQTQVDSPSPGQGHSKPN